MSALDGSEELYPVGKTLPDLISSPGSSELGAHSGNTHLYSLIAAPSSENDVFLCGAGRTLAGGGHKHHAVHIAVVGRVYDILCRDTELCAWGRRVCE